MKNKAIFVLIAVLIMTETVVFSKGGLDNFKKENEYNQTQFTDVSQGDWFYDNVKTVFEYGIMTGASDDFFNTGGTLTIAESLAIYTRLHQTYQNVKIKPSSSTPWYQKYIDYASETGFEFAENCNFEEVINRADFATILCSAVPLDALSAINDIKVIPDVSPDAYYYNPVCSLYRAGVLSGSNEYGIYSPMSSISRSEAAAIISRIIVPSLRKQFTLTEAPFSPVPANQLANRSSLKRKLSDAQFQQAYDIAAELVRPYAHYSREEQLIGVATQLRQLFENSMGYSMTEEHYNDVYGYLVNGTASCAGCTRATGLCLNILGIPYEHVNENQYSHQWCRVNINGVYWICDAYGLYVGPEEVPYQHPYF